MKCLNVRSYTAMQLRRGYIAGPLFALHAASGNIVLPMLAARTQISAKSSNQLGLLPWPLSCALQQAYRSAIPQH